MASLHPRAAPLPRTPPLPCTPTPRARPVGAQRSVHQRPISRALRSRVDCDPHGAVGGGGAPRTSIPQRPPVEHRADGAAGATEHGERCTGCGTTHPATEHPAPSAQRRAPGTEHRAPSTEHRAPSTKHRAPRPRRRAANRGRRHVDPRPEATEAHTRHVRGPRHRALDASRHRAGDPPLAPHHRLPHAPGHPCPARVWSPVPGRSADSRTAGDVFPKPPSRPGRSRPPAPSPPPSHCTPCSPPTVATCHAVPTGRRTPRTCRPASRHGPAEAQPHAASAVAGSDRSSCASEHTLATAAGSLTRARLAEFDTTTRFRHQKRFVRTP